jgi:hypothetical protein
MMGFGALNPSYALGSGADPVEIGERQGERS